MVAKKSVVFKNAIIDTAEGTITEITRVLSPRLPRTVRMSSI